MPIAVIWRHLNFNGDIRNYWLKSEGWHNDKHDKMDESEQMDNTEIVKRKKNCSESPDIVLIGRQHAVVFDIDKLILPGIDLSVKYMPNDDKFCIMSSDRDNLGPKVVIDDMNLIICTKQLFDATKFTNQTLVGNKHSASLHLCVEEVRGHPR